MHILYYSQFCYFCQKVLIFLRGKKTSIETRNIHESNHRQELLKGGGKSQVPCLRIEQVFENNKAEVIWLYESDDIIDYIKKNSLAD